MNELEKQLATILEKALNVAEQTGDFVMEQAPQLLQEFYKWHIFENIYYMIIAFVILISSRYIPYVWLNKYKDDHNDDIVFFKKTGDDGGITAWVLFICGIIAFLIIFLIALYDLTFILVAPKLYLIEYFVK